MKCGVHIATQKKARAGLLIGDRLRCWRELQEGLRMVDCVGPAFLRLNCSQLNVLTLHILMALFFRSGSHLPENNLIALI